MTKIRVAFIKYEGLTSGGTERWLQSVAAYLNKDAFETTYYYTGNSEAGREQFLLSHGVQTVQVRAGGLSASGQWLNTDFFEKFAENPHDLIQTATDGRRTWPFHLLRKPVVQSVHYDGGVDFSPNVHHTFHLSSWWRERWIALGGSRRRSSVAVVGVDGPLEVPDMRASLGIPGNALVAGFHQRADDNIFSPIPLNAFAASAPAGSWFLILGGSSLYSEQAARLGLGNFRRIPYSADRGTVSSFLRTLDIFAHGRRDGETFGYVFAEALLHKLPCLGHAARANAHRDTMGPGGLWAENEEEYAQALKRLFLEPDLRQHLAERGERFARETYSNEAAISHIERIYEEIHKIYGGRALPYAWHRFNLRLSCHMRRLSHIIKQLGRSLGRLINLGGRAWRDRPTTWLKLKKKFKSFHPGPKFSKQF